MSDKNYYLYLWINPNSDEREMRACWICNRVKAPKDIKEAFAVEGEAPCMPAESPEILRSAMTFCTISCTSLSSVFTDLPPL